MGSLNIDLVYVNALFILPWAKKDSAFMFTLPLRFTPIAQNSQPYQTFQKSTVSVWDDESFLVRDTILLEGGYLVMVKPVHLAMWNLF